MTPSELAAASGAPWVGNGLQQAGNNGPAPPQVGLNPGRQGWTTVAGGIMGHFMPGAGALMGLGNAFNGAIAANQQMNAMNAMTGAQPTLGTTLGDALGGATGMHTSPYSAGMGGYGTPGVGGYLGMENALDPGVMGAARAIGANASQAVQGAAANPATNNEAGYAAAIGTRLANVGLSPSVLGSSGNAGGGNGGGSYGGYGDGSHADEGTGPGGLRGGGT